MSTQNEKKAPAAQASSSLVVELASFLKALAAGDMKSHTTTMEIDGIVYTSSKIPARIGWELLPRIGTLLGAAMGPLLGEGEGIDAAVILSVCQQAMTDGMMPVTLDLLQSMECNKLQGIEDRHGRVADEFDQHFAGEYVHLVKVLIFAFRHNYLGFSRGSR